jgi:hypothetical protein
MISVKYNLRLDASKPGCQATIYTKQGDTKSRLVVAHIHNNGSVFPVSDDMSVVLNATKPDGTIVFNTAAVNEDGSISIELTSGMLTAAGRVECEFQIFNGDGVLLTTPRFDILVEAVIDTSEAIESTDEYSALMEALMSVSGITEAEAGRIAAEAARALAESGRASAESGRVSAEALRVSAESTRASAESGRVSAESIRASAESGRVSAESTRASAESGRVSAENIRVSNESARQSAESARVSAEAGRVSAEVARESAKADMIAATEAATDAAESALEAADLAIVAAQSVVSVEDIELVSGNHAPGTYDTYRMTLTDGNYIDLVVWNGANGEGSGDMMASIYDPNGKHADAFSMGNMDETSTKKIMTDAERTKLAGIETGAQVNVQSDWDASSGDAYIKNKPTLGSLAAKDTVSISDITGLASALAGKANKSVEYTGTLDKDDWTGTGPYEQTVSVSGMTSGAMKGGFGLPESATLEQIEAAGAAMIRIKSRSSGSVTFEAKEVPTIDIPFVILEVD